VFFVGQLQRTNKTRFLRFGQIAIVPFFNVRFLYLQQKSHVENSFQRGCISFLATNPKNVWKNWTHRY